MSSFREELIRRMAVDQKEMTEMVFRENSEWLKEQLKTNEFLTISNTCIQASQAGWIIAQHADHDLEFQEQYLALLIEYKTDIMKEWIAYLTDRVEIKKTGKQIFGTQFNQPIDYEKSLDALRAEYGLATLEENGNRPS